MNKPYDSKYSQACPFCGRVIVVEYDSMLKDNEDFVVNIKQYLSDSVCSHIKHEHVKPGITASSLIKPVKLTMTNQFNDMFGESNPKETLFYVVASGHIAIGIILLVVWILTKILL